MFLIETLIGPRIEGRWFKGDQRYPTRDAAQRAITALDHAFRAVNPEVRWIMRRVVGT